MTSRVFPFVRPSVAPPRPLRRATGMLALLGQAGVALACLLLWHLLVAWQWVPSSGVAAPLPALARWGELLLTAAYWQVLGHTLAGWFIGMAISVLIAVPLGVAIGLSRFLSDSTRFTIDFLRTVPPVALLPVVLLLLGPTLTMKVTLIVVGTLWPMLIQSIYAASQIDPVLRDVAQSFRLPRGHRIRFLLLPSVAPFVATGLRIAATVSLLLSVAGEYIGGAPGLGAALGSAEQSGNLPEMYAYILTAATLGVAINFGFIVLQRQLLWWHPSVRTAPRG